MTTQKERRTFREISPEQQVRAVQRLIEGEELSSIALQFGTSEPVLQEALKCFCRGARKALENGHPGNSKKHERVPIGDPQVSFGLAALINSTTTTPFLEQYWPDRCSAFHGPVERLPFPPELLNLERLAHVENLRFSLFGRKGFRASIVNGAEAMLFYKNGETLYIKGLERAFPVLRDLCRGLGRELKVDPAHIAVEGFASPAGAGASMHYDFDVDFNVQLKGRKIWRIAPNEHVQNPLQSLAIREGIAALSPFDGKPLPSTMPRTSTRIEASPGTVIFLPRGMWHETEVLEDSFARRGDSASPGVGLAGGAAIAGMAPPGGNGSMSFGVEDPDRSWRPSGQEKSRRLRKMGKLENGSFRGTAGTKPDRAHKIPISRTWTRFRLIVIELDTLARPAHGTDGRAGWRAPSLERSEGVMSAQV